MALCVYVCWRPTKKSRCQYTERMPDWTVAVLRSVLSLMVDKGD